MRDRVYFCPSCGSFGYHIQGTISHDGDEGIGVAECGCRDEIGMEVEEEFHLRKVNTFHFASSKDGWTLGWLIEATGPDSQALEFLAATGVDLQKGECTHGEDCGYAYPEKARYMGQCPITGLHVVTQEWVINKR